MTQVLDSTLFLPEPDPLEVKYTVISVDDHLVEPRDMFEGRLPSKLQERAPKIVVIVARGRRRSGLVIENANRVSPESTPASSSPFCQTASALGARGRSQRARRERADRQTGEE